MRCRHCAGPTRVVATVHRDDGTHRWLRCLECGEPTRTLEIYHLNTKPGPPPGRPKRGTVARGSANGAAVLTEDDVRRLRDLAARGVPHKQLALKFGLHICTISRIVNRKLWAHV